MNDRYDLVGEPDKGPYAPPYLPDDPMPDATLRCAVTGSVDADATCSCAGCTAARVRQR